jgi:hypothetical protein
VIRGRLPLRTIASLPFFPSLRILGCLLVLVLAIPILVDRIGFYQIWDRQVEIHYV